MPDVKPGPTRRYGGQSSDQRIAERRVTLLEAAFALIADQGWPALRIDALCRQAQLNKRYFYESFPNLDAVAAALTRQLAEAAIEVTLAAISTEMDAEEATAVAVGAFVRHLTDDPRRARVLFGAIPPGEAAAAHRQAAIRRVVEAAANVGQGLHALADTPAVHVAASMLVGGTSQAIVDWLDQGAGRGDAADTEAGGDTGPVTAGDREELITLLVAMWQVVGAEAARLSAGAPQSEGRYSSRSQSTVPESPSA